MTRVKEKRIAHCPKCRKQTAWVYISGVQPFWLCLICATREEAPLQEASPRRETHARVKATLRLKLTCSHRRAVLLSCRAAQAIEAARQIRQERRALVACVRAQRYKGYTPH